MVRETSLTVEERLCQLLRHLGIERVHLAARGPMDWESFIAAHPEMISSLTLVCPGGLNVGVLGSISSRVLIFAPEQGAGTEGIRRGVANLPGATLVTLADYSVSYTTDMVAERGEVISAAMIDHLGRIDREEEETASPLEEGEGEVVGVSYRIQGFGPPLLLFPLGFAPSQWEPIVPQLAERYATITIGGTELGMAHILERRGRQAGYLGVVERLVREVQLKPGENVLEVGCGTGVLDRWLARRTAGANRIVGVDINRYLLREGTALVQKEGLEGQVELRQGNAEDIPFPDGSFDVVMSSTVMEELDADRMMAELVRVTRPGGRVGVIVRAVDMPLLPNFELSEALKAKAASARFGGVEESGCGDISLYRRFYEAGLAPVKMFPQYGVVTAADQPYMQLVQGFVLGTLNAEEAEEWRDAVARSEGDNTFFIATPYHCAAGTKPV